MNKGRKNYQEMAQRLEEKCNFLDSVMREYSNYVKSQAQQQKGSSQTSLFHESSEKKSAE